MVHRDLSAVMRPAAATHRAPHPSRVVTVLFVSGWISIAGLFAALAAPSRAAAQNPAFVSSTLWSSAQAVAVIDDVALVLFSAGMATFDVSNPTVPVLLERFDRVDEPPAFHDIRIAGDRAFVAAGAAGLQVYDLSEPSHPVLIATCDTPGDAWDVEIAGGLAYLADGFEGGLRIIDISNPEKPRLLGGCATQGGSYAVAIAGDVAYCADGIEGMSVIDVADPHHPQFTSRVYDMAYPPSDLVVCGGYLYSIGSQGEKSIWDSSGLTVLDISNPSVPVRHGTYRSDEGTNALAVRGTLAYIANADGSLTTVDVTDPDAPTEITEVETGGYSNSICLEGDRAYVSSDSGILAILDLSVPTAPAVLGHWWEASNAYDVDIQGGLAYVADRMYGLHIVDVSAPEDPIILSHLPLPDGPWALAAAGSFVYVADDSAGVLALDVTDPSSPAIVGQVGTIASDIEYDGRYLYVVARNQGLRVIDARDPRNLTIVGSCPIPGWLSSVSVAGRYACVSDGAAMYVVDIADPTHPVQRGTYAPYGNVRGVTFDGSYAYASVGSDGLFVVDVTNPDAPVYVTELHLGGNVHGTCLNGDLLYVAAAGLQVIDVSDPRHPQVVGSNPRGFSFRVSVEGSLVCTAAGGSLDILRFDPSAAADEPPDLRRASRLELLVPSPVRGATEFVVRLSRPQRLRVDLLDVTGRRLDSLHDGNASNGEVRLRWNAGGIPAGVYYLRMVAAEGAISRPVVVVR